MPAVIGAFKAVSVNSSGVLQTGDAAVIVPKSVSKSYVGSGVSNTGDFPRSVNLVNTTNSNDQDVNDSNVLSSL